MLELNSRLKKMGLQWIMKKYLIIVLMAGFLAAGESYGKEDVYYCGEIDSIGFHYDTERGKYERNGFHTKKFKMKLDTDSKRIDLILDEDKESYLCTIAYQPISPELMSCSESSGLFHFNFNTKTGRFVYSMGGGYVGGDHDTISVSYGKCDKF